eukprot:403361759
MEQDQKKIILYIDWASQPSRSVVAFCKINKIPHELKIIRVGKGQHLTEDYQKISPFVQVPTLQEINEKTGETFTLYESHTILRYLAMTRNCGDHWYPKDVMKHTQINEYLEWHHNNIRQSMSYTIYYTLFYPMIFKKQMNKAIIQELRERMKDDLDFIEKQLIDKQYICGQEITIADIILASELIQSKFINLDLSKYINIQGYIQRLIFEIPEMHDVHKPMLQLAKQSLKKNSEKAKL